MNIRALDNLKIANANTIINQWTGFYMITASVMKGLNAKLTKCSSNIQLQGDRYQNFLSCQIDLCLLRIWRLI